MKLFFRHIVITALIILLLFASMISSAQLILTTSTLVNHHCHGCTFSGSSIMINEVMISPENGDGCIYGTMGSNSCRGEWIELYNPDSCCPVDVSCYFLGNTANDDVIGFTFSYPAAFELPVGTVVPPAGFLVVRGEFAPQVPSQLLVQNGGRTVEVVVTDNSPVCIGEGNRLWFPNAGGWFAFYDEDGVPQDAIYWNNPDNFVHNDHPCNPPAGCPFSGVLPSFGEIPGGIKTYIDYDDPLTELSYRREPDGGPWVLNDQAPATYGSPNVSTNVFQYCDGQATVDVSGGTPPYTYIWDDCRAQTTATATMLCAGTYCVTVTDALSQSAIACVTISDDVPPVTLLPFDTVCSNHAPYTLTGGLPAGGTYTGPSVSGNVFVPANAGPGTHTIKYTYRDANECTGIATQTVTVMESPVVSVSSPHTDGCEPDTIFLNGSIQSSAAGLNYRWTGPANFTSGSLNPVIYNAGAANSGKYVLSVTDTNVCHASDSINITIYPTPVLLVDPAISHICRDSLLWVRASGAETYAWFSPAGVVVNTKDVLKAWPDESTVYQVYGYNQYGCYDHATVRVFVYRSPEFDLPDTLFLCPGETVTLHTVSGDSVIYTWQDGSHLESLTVTEPGTYWVWGINPGCIVGDTCVVLPCTRFEVPNCFTPNGDGVNDIFLPKSTVAFSEYEMLIYDRFGELVFRTRDLYEGWDGRFKTKPAMTDVYTWVIFYTPLEGGKSYRAGWVMLLK